MLFSVRLALASNFQYFGWKQQVTLVFDLISVELRSVVWLNVFDWLVGMVPYQRDSGILWINKISFYRNLLLPSVQHTVREFDGLKRSFAVILKYPTRVSVCPRIFPTFVRLKGAVARIYFSQPIYAISGIPGIRTLVSRVAQLGKDAQLIELFRPRPESIVSFSSDWT